MSERPKQERVWNAYGQAVGAALGVELLMRIANLTTRTLLLKARRCSPQNYQAQLAKLNANALAGTFGQVVVQFRELFPDLVTPLFLEASDNAVSFRNTLTHHFLIHHLPHLMTEEGLDIMAAECTLYLDHFQRLEQYVRDESGIDFSVFEEVVLAAAARHPPHPYAAWLAGDRTKEPK